jgi:hypothetical protein
MTRELSETLPDELVTRLDGHDLAAMEGDTYLLVTTDQEGWPHIAMLSAGEVLAVSAGELRLALWPGSSTTASLRARSRALFAYFAPGTAYYVQLEVQPYKGGAAVGDRLARFSARVKRSLVDRVDYAEITSGIRFRLKDPVQVLRRWEQAISTLRS